ncbi:MAG: hypothetical protein RL417_957 [Pseudomonadota bacterium]
MAKSNLTIPDASVAVKWFVDEEGSDRAYRVLEDILASADRFIVPELFFFELVNVVGRLVEDREDPRFELIDIILSSGIGRAPMAPELRRLTGRYQELGLSGYDGAYAALADFVGGVWLTADREAVERLGPRGVGVLL